MLRRQRPVRFERDALGQTGVKSVIMLEGINDIGFAGQPDTGCAAPNNPDVTAAQIEIGDKKLIAEAHAKGVKVYAGTLTPFMGSNAVYDGYDGTAHGEQLREQVNSWIRTSHAFDGVVDFDQATRDPADPQYLNPVYDADSAANSTADNLHPNDWLRGHGRRCPVVLHRVTAANNGMRPVTAPD